MLARYLQRHPVAAGAKESESPVFTTRQGARVKLHILQRRFQHLRKLASIHRAADVRYQPRLHDLRHTFAVHRLTSWYREGADVQRLLPLLSVYLGHAHLAATQVYLSMTPELLAEAGGRFERYAEEGINHD